jgi:hypothetical protein
MAVLTETLTEASAPTAAGGRPAGAEADPATGWGFAAAGGEPAAVVAGAGSTDPAGGSDVGVGTSSGATVWSAAATSLVVEATAGSERPCEARDGGGLGGWERRLSGFDPGIGKGRVGNGTVRCHP